MWGLLRNFACQNRPVNRYLTYILLALCSLCAAGAEAPDSARAPRRPSCWTLIEPLGLRQEAVFDTLPYNYQRQAVPSLVSDAYATTGNLGCEGQNQIFFRRGERRPFFFLDALDAWLPGPQKFYNVYVPFTQLSYNFGGNKQTAQDRLRMDFAGNAGRRVGLGAKLDYLYSKGCYQAQSSKDFTFGFSGYYKGDRYELQAYYTHWNLLNKENGGITDPLYITDPAAVQGGVSHIASDNIPVRLTHAHNRINGQQLYLNQSYKIGYWREVEVNDTLTREVYVPVTRFIWTLDYQSGHRIFLNTDASQGRDFWENTYFDASSTRDDTRFSSFSNTVGVALIEGFRPWAKFGLSAFATYDLRSFKQPMAALLNREDVEDPSELSPLPEGYSIKEKEKQNLLWIGAQLIRQSGTLLNYEADFRMGLSGDVAADLELSGRATTHFRLLGDTVGVEVYGRFRNTAQPYLLRHYIGNHLLWDNDFGKTRSLRAGGRLSLPWINTTIEAGFENLQNYVYFNTASLPAQCGGSIQILNASLSNHLNFGIWNWDNRLTAQASSRQDVLPLPAFTIYSNMYLHFLAFKVLDVQLGVDCDYYTRYWAPAYQPATMSFRVQDEVKCGNFPFMNAYVTCRLHKTRFFVMMSHFNQGWFSKEYFAAPGYPLNPRRLQFGLSIDFAN